MKKTTSLTRIICGVSAIGLLAGAYGTCYLDQVVLCYAYGDHLPTYTYSCPNSMNYTEESGYVSGTTGATTYYPYAYQNAWAHGVYSVTAGGFGTYARTWLCDSDVPDVYGGNGDQAYLGAGNGFEAAVYDECAGITYTSQIETASKWGGNSNTQMIPYATLAQSLFGGAQAGGATVACTY